MMMKTLCLALVAWFWACGLGAFAQAPLQTTTVYSENFEKAPLGPVDRLPGGVHDNTFAGGPTPLRVVDTGDSRHGRALEVKTHGFAQIVLGELALKKTDCTASPWT